MPHEPKAFVLKSTWHALRTELLALTRVHIDGGQMKQLSDGIAFDLSAPAGWHPFKATLGGSTVTLERGLVYLSGRIFPFGRTQIAVPATDWVIWLSVPVTFTVPGGGSVYPLAPSSLVFEAGSFTAAIGADAIVYYTGGGALTTTAGTVRWPIVSRQNGILCQHVFSHLIFNFHANGHLHDTGSFPSA